MYRLR